MLKALRPVKSFRCRFSRWVGMAALLSGFAAPAMAEDLLTFIDGGEVSGVISAITREGVITGENLPANLKIDRLLHVDLSTGPVERRFQGAEVFLAAEGGVLSARAVELSDDVCTLKDTVAGDLDIKVERLGSILLQDGDPAEVFKRAQALPLTLSDIVFVRSSEGPRAIEVLLESIGQDSVTFRWNGETRDVPLERIYAVVFADRAYEPVSTLCRVQMRNGDIIVGQISELADDRLKIRVDFHPELELPFRQIVGIEVESPRLSYLSEVEPLEVDEETLLTLPAQWQRDYSVGGRPLSLNQHTYSHGIGVHAASRLTFPVERRFDTLLSLVGIDDETEGRGDCVIVVLADDEEIYRQRIRGGEPARELRLDISGARRVTLAVEPGEDYDLADHVSWCDLRLLSLQGE